MVPESATAIMSLAYLADLDSKLEPFTAAYGLNADAETLENGQVQVTVIGKSAHRFNPEKRCQRSNLFGKDIADQFRL